MRIGLLNVVNDAGNGAMNKDLAGGMGTFSTFGTGFLINTLSFIKSKSVRLPVISFAYLQAILKDKGHSVKYLESDVDEQYDIILIYGSLVDFRNEIKACENIKKKHPETIVGFFGSFPTVRPDIFRSADFVIVGEVESYFLYEFNDTKNLPKIINVAKLINMNDLPTPDWDGFPINHYSYFPAIKEKPLVAIQASRGCPFSCSYYCAYGMIQGQKYRARDTIKLIEDVKILKKKYGIKALLFRDPVFGLDRKQAVMFAKGLIDNKIDIRFSIETRLDLLDTDLLELLFKTGLRNINVGIETTDIDISKENKRKLIEKSHQEEIIKFCKKIGIKVSAFYILGYKGDTKESIQKTIDYAILLNTNVAQFSISCPYPGTKYFDELNSEGMICQDDFEKFNSTNLVFKHTLLSEKELTSLKEEAFRRYYFSTRYLKEFIKWRIREFFL